MSTQFKAAHNLQQGEEASYCKIACVLFVCVCATLVSNSMHSCVGISNQFSNIEGKAMVFSSRAQIRIRKLFRDKRALHEEPLFPSPSLVFARRAAASRSNIAMRLCTSHCAACLRSRLVHHGPPTRRSFQQHKGASKAISIFCRT